MQRWQVGNKYVSTISKKQTVGIIVVNHNQFCERQIHFDTSTLLNYNITWPHFGQVVLEATVLTGLLPLADLTFVDIIAKQLTATNYKFIQVSKYPLITCIT